MMNLDRASNDWTFHRCTDKWGIGISSISDTVVRYLPIFLTVFRD